MKRSVLITLSLLVLSPVYAFGQSSRYDNVVLRSGMGMGGANVAVCTTLATTAASVSANIAVLTMASNPVTAGFAASTQLTVAGFTGGDTYFNGTFTILSVTPTTIVYPLIHANASASSNGTAFQTGNATTSCAPLATIFTDSTGLTPSGNPFAADGLGNYGFWATTGLYSVQIYGSGIPTKVSLVTVSGNVMSNAGVFTNTQMNEYLQSLINSCSPATENSIQPGKSTDALTGCLAVPVGATVYGANSVAGYANTSATTPNVDAGYFSCRVLVNSGKCWGINPVAIDVSGLTTGVKLLNEFDIQPQNAASAYTAVNGGLFNPFAPGLADGTTFANAFGPLCSKGQPGGIWQLCFSTSDGASADFGLMGSKTTSANSNSQGLLANTRDAGNVIRSHSIFADNSGAWTFNSFNGKFIFDKNAVQQGIFDLSANTAPRTYMFPDTTGTVCLVSTCSGTLPPGTTVSGSDISFPGNVCINGPDPHWDIRCFGASGSIQSTTATCTSGTTTCTLVAAIDFKNGPGYQGIRINGAGASSLPYFGQITAGAGTTTITVSPAIGTSVSGVTADHDDIPAINAAVDACTASYIAGGGGGGGGPIFFPAGTFQQKSGPVHHHSAACAFTGPPGTKLSANLAVWNQGSVSFGPTLVSTGAFSVATYMASASFPAALLTGSGTAFGMNGNNGAFNARDCKVCAEFNGLQQIEIDAVFNFSALPGAAMPLISSSGMRDSVQGQQTAIQIRTDSGNHAVCIINVAGTARTVTDTAALTTGSNIELTCNYDHANVRLFKNGTSVGTPVAVVGTVTQSPVEEVFIGTSMRHFPEGFPDLFNFVNTNNVSVDGLRISNLARHTSNFTAITAKWTLAQVDANTLIQCDWDSQPDVFTVCYTGNGGSTPFPVYLPYHRSVCGGGIDNFAISNMAFGDASGRDYDGIYFSGGSGWRLENISFNTTRNGILTDGCNFDYHMRDVELSGFGNNTRYVTALNSGIGLLDNIHASQAQVPLVLPGNGVYNHIFLSPSGSGGTDQMSILVKSAGAQTIGGVKPFAMLNDVEADIEASLAPYQTVLMLDQVGSAQINGGDYECGTANTTCQPITINGGGAVQINGAGLSANAAAASLVHVPSPLPSSPIMLNGIQNPINLPLTDAGTTIVCGGTGSGSVSGCSMPTYSTSTNCAQNTASPAACGSSAAGAFVVPTTTTTYTVNTTAVLGTTSRIFLTPITFAANLPSSPTCVAPAAGAVTISAVVANTSFTFALPSTTGQTCWQYHIMN